MALHMGLEKRIHTKLRDPLKVLPGVLGEARGRRDMDVNTKGGQESAICNKASGRATDCDRDGEVSR